MPVGERGDVRRRVVALLEADVEPVVVEMANSVGMRFALVPAGRFLMGSPPDEPHHQSNEQLQEIEIRGPFWMSVFPVTNAQWKGIMGGRGPADDQPRTDVSHDNVRQFSGRLNSLAEEAKNERRYRLPDEAEWEYACRGGGVSVEAYCLKAPSATLSPEQARFGLPFGSRPCKVGCYEANPLGLCDMHGNVGEWCADGFGESAGGGIWPGRRTAPADGAYRFVRGGSWCDAASVCRAAARKGLAYWYSSHDLGFRVVAEVG
jgi:formylglycine-generating enzyme required for sulfatase activity